MAATRTKAAPAPLVRFVRHPKRPAWGVGCVIDVFAGLMRVRFGDGVTREFRADVLERVADADVPPEMFAPAPVAAPAERAARPRKARAK